MGFSCRRRMVLPCRLTGLNYRDLAATVGIKSASIHYHFPNKVDLGVAVAKRYWEDTAADLEDLSAETPDPIRCLHRYPEIFRRSLESDNRMCLCSFMAAEYDGLPEVLRTEVQSFAEVNVAWLSRLLRACDGTVADGSEARARAVYAAVAGAQLLARSRSDVSLFDRLIESYREMGVLPA